MYNLTWGSKEHVALINSVIQHLENKDIPTVRSYVDWLVYTSVYCVKDGTSDASDLFRLAELSNYTKTLEECAEATLHLYMIIRRVNVITSGKYYEKIEFDNIGVDYSTPDCKLNIRGSSANKVICDDFSSMPTGEMPPHS